MQEGHLIQEVVDFLYHEADLMDEGKWREWLQLMTDDVLYLMPVRVTEERGKGAGFTTQMTHFHEDRQTLELRVRRMETDFAWAEDPPSRTRHFVTNIRVFPTERPNEIRVRSNVLLYRTRGDVPSADLLSAVREDILRKVDGQWRLARRTVYLDHSVVTTPNLAIFL
jgi:ethylbenzene dioxygenase beta subunit